ncbi:MAG: hypothetical protein A2521_11705 [Deltaproteobacteria bacterium RIFOXYD12_FULL_57_12]|nr:MAG: hypothetical protein A2521_11705 [Deltaproteobacteria bacterium RIFOXYD12_FULL_57_12]
MSDLYSSPQNKIHLHRASWVLAASDSAPGGLLLENAGVVVDRGRILAVGGFAGLRRQYSGCAVIDHDESLLAPALVNAHVHLELSCLAGLGRDGVEPKRDFTEWIRELLQMRRDFAQTTGDAVEAVRVAGRRALDDLWNSGVGLVADIGNEAQSGLIGRGHPVQVFFYREMLGMTDTAVQETMQRVGGLPDTDRSAFTAHAPYSVAPELLRFLKARAAARDQVFSIHVAESPAEVEFLQQGTGSFRMFLEERRVWDGTFAVPGVAPVTYLDRLGLLDAKTLCVHAVQVSDQEIALLAERGARICLCPGSNRRTGVGKAPVPAMLAAGILPALGTDSLASNPVLDLWQEMRILRQDHPGIAPETVFAMATRGGAAALGRADAFGSLAPGKEAAILEIRDSRLSAVTDVFEILTSPGLSPEVTWVS